MNKNPLRCQHSTGLRKYDRCMRNAAVQVDDVPMCLQHARMCIPRITPLPSKDDGVPKILRFMQFLGLSIDNFDTAQLIGKQFVMVACNKEWRFEDGRARQL